MGTNRMGLVDLPDELVSRCMSALEDGDVSSLTACMGTCKKLLHLVLQQRSPWLLVELRAAAEAETKRRALVQLAPCSSLRKLKIVLRSQDPSEEQLRTLLVPPATCNNPAWLPGITALCIERGRPEGVELSLDKLPLLPLPVLSDCVAQACFGLQHLTLKGISVHGEDREPGEQRPPAPCQLQCLTMQQCKYALPASIFARQLRALPSITLLEVDGHMGSGAVGNSQISAIADSVSGQLTAVIWNGHPSFPPIPIVNLLLSKPYPVLHSLDVRYILVDDGALDAILQHAPTLKHLHVGSFSLERSHDTAICGWETVGFEQGLPVACMGMLPLQGRPQLQLTGRDCTLQYMADLETLSDLSLTRDGVAAVQRCGGLKGLGGGPPPTVCLDFNEHCPQDQVWQLFIVCMPLWENVPSIRLANFPITRQYLTVIGRLPACTHLEMSRCFVEDDVWQDMMTLLPRVEVLRLDRDTIWVDAPFLQLLQMCHTAARPFRLEMEPGAFGLTRLDQPFRDALEFTCRHVELVVLDH